MFTPFTIYCCDDIEKVVVDGQISIHATNDIKKGTLLLVEKGLVDTKQTLIQLIMKVAKLQEYCMNFYPRQDNEEVTPEIIRKKLNHNGWDWENNRMGMFFSLAMFNHSCTPNAFMVEMQINNSHWYIYDALVALKDIKKGEEVTIIYNETAGHDCSIFNWNCECQMSFEQRKSNFVNAVKSSEKLVAIQEGKIQRLIKNFEQYDYHEELEKDIRIFYIEYYLENKLSIDHAKYANKDMVDIIKQKIHIDDLDKDMQDFQIGCYEDQDMEELDRMEDDIENKIDNDSLIESLNYGLIHGDEYLISFALKNKVVLNSIQIKDLIICARWMHKESSGYEEIWDIVVRYLEENNLEKYMDFALNYYSHEELKAYHE